jgi:hypothetical protein
MYTCFAIKTSSTLIKETNSAFTIITTKGSFANLLFPDLPRALKLPPKKSCAPGAIR